MRCWRQGYYDSLQEIGEAFADREGFARFGEYCLLKEKGLNKPAVAAAKSFVAAAEDLEKGRQREIACVLAGLEFDENRWRSLLPFHVKEFLKAVFLDWVEEEPLCAAA